jgi:hypothetical protein
MSDRVRVYRKENEELIAKAEKLKMDNKNLEK